MYGRSFGHQGLNFPSYRPDLWSPNHTPSTQKPLLEKAWTAPVVMAFNFCSWTGTMRQRLKVSVLDTGYFTRRWRQPLVSAGKMQAGSPLGIVGLSNRYQMVLPLFPKLCFILVVNYYLFFRNCYAYPSYTLLCIHESCLILNNVWK